MIQWIRKIWKDSVWSTVIATGIVSAFLLIYNYFSDGKLYQFFVIKIEIFWTLIACAFLLVAVWIINRIVNSKKRHLKYTKDRFSGIDIIWNYNEDGSVFSIMPICPKCKSIATTETHPDDANTMIINGRSRKIFKCSECGYTVNSKYDNPLNYEGDILYKIHNKYGYYIKSNSAKKNDNTR